MEIVRPSPQRVAPKCGLFGICGGCQYQHLAYEAQLEWKRKQVADLMERIGGIKCTPLPTKPSPMQKAEKFGFPDRFRKSRKTHRTR